MPEAPSLRRFCFPAMAMSRADFGQSRKPKDKPVLGHDPSGPISHNQHDDGNRHTCASVGSSKPQDGTRQPKRKHTHAEHCQIGSKVI
jgi:hypothetical protein